MTFVHLNVHSKASMLYASADNKALVKRAKELGQPAVALTDYGNVYEAINFYKAASNEGVKPILGATLFFCEDAAELRVQKSRAFNHIVLLAENDIGWQNITRLISHANDADHFFYNPRIDFDLLEQYNEGIIALTGNTRDGIISSHLFDRTDEYGEVLSKGAPFRAEALVRRFLKIFDKDSFFLEVQDTGDPVQEEVNEKLRDIAEKYGLRTVATNNVHYVNPADAESHRTLLSMENNRYNRLTHTNFDEEEYYLKSRDDLLESPFLLSNELDAALEVASRCQVNIDLKKHRLPKYQFVPDGHTSMSYLTKLANDGLVALGIEPNSQGDFETYQHRLDRELKDIEDMGFADYFLLVYDVVHWCHQNDILLGYGRGSVGGSLVSYALGITNINPMEYGLIWERFLNKGRGGLPDIDTDVPKSRRQEVLEYIRQRFGRGNVAQIVNYNSLKAKAVLKEVFRAYDMDFEEANKITACVPGKNEDHTDPTLEEALAMSPELRKYEQKYPAWFKIARDLEGCYKTTGIHAAAVVISDTPFDSSPYPLARSKDGDLIFGWDMDTVDTLHLLKLDILGLSTLDDITETRRLVNKRRGLNISRETMPLNDPVTFAMLGQGFTIGVFQIEKQLGRIWSKNLEPENIEQLADLGSLIRPGPMECLAGDTPILTWVGGKKKSYRYKTIEQLHADYTKLRLKQYGKDAGGPPQLGICSVDESTHSIVPNNAVKIVKTGIKDVYDLTLAVDYNGYRLQRNSLHIKASLGHKFLTIRYGELSPRWRELREIELDDYVCVLKKQYTKNKSNKHAQGWRHFKDIATQHYQKRCVFCDWNEASFDVHHIEGSRYTNNKPENLCFLCPNHHRMISEGILDQEELLGERKKYQLPNTDDVMYCRVHSIDKVGRMPTYDIAMKDPHHNYIAGDFVVHNSDMHTKYKEVKFNEAKPAYIHSALKPIMSKTQSSLLYQEQVIEICKQLAGLSLVDADKVRKAMGKKKPEEMKKWKEVFTTGCESNGIAASTAAKIWGYVDKFAGYGFNKSHGVGYALLAYETAYLKANYTLEFICAKLRHAKDMPDKFERIGALMYDAKLFGIDVTPPRVKLPKATAKDMMNFSITDDTTIAFGLTALKGVGDAAARRAISFAKNAADFDDFLKETIGAKPGVSTTVVEALIKSGAFGDMGQHRVRMMARYRLFNGLTDKEKVMVFDLAETEGLTGADWVRVVRGLSDDSKIDEIKERYQLNRPPNVARRARLREALRIHDGVDLFDNLGQNIVWEKFYLGVSLSGSEADVYKARDKCVDLIKSGEPGTEFEIAVCLDSVRAILTKKGDPMAFVTGRDKTYSLDGIVVFPNTFKYCESLLEEGNVVKVCGKINDRGSFVADKVERLS